MPIRVISGSAKGRKLKLVPGDTTRPVMDRVKEALFSILGRDIYEAVFLDLFAGTGSVGIEALSRGAAKAVFVELEGKAVRTIQENLEITRLGENAVIRQTDVLNLLKQQPTESYDFIYVAPPQYKRIWLHVMEALDQNPAWIPYSTTVIVQIDPKEQEDIVFRHLTPYDTRVYGHTMLWFFTSHYMPSR